MTPPTGRRGGMSEDGNLWCPGTLRPVSSSHQGYQEHDTGNEENDTSCPHHGITGIDACTNEEEGAHDKEHPPYDVICSIRFLFVVHFFSSKERQCQKQEGQTCPLSCTVPYKRYRHCPIYSHSSIRKPITAIGSPRTMSAAAHECPS